MTEKILRREEFEQLEEDIQLDLLHKHGVHVGKRNHNNRIIILIQLYSFYVEVYYTKYRKEIEHMIISGDTEILQPYLDQIHVRDLNKK